MSENIEISSEKWSFLDIKGIKCIARKSSYKIGDYVILSLNPRMCSYNYTIEDAIKGFEVLNNKIEDIEDGVLLSLPLEIMDEEKNENIEMSGQAAYILSEFLTDGTDNIYDFLGDVNKEEYDEDAIRTGWDLETVKILLEE